MKVNVIKIIFYIWLFLIILLALIPISTASKIKIHSKTFRIDYFEHFIVFAIGGVLNVFKENDFSSKKNKISLIKWLSILILLSLIVEIIQIFVPFRTVNIKDFLFNVYGLFTGTILSIIYLSLKKYFFINKKEKLL